MRATPTPDMMIPNSVGEWTLRDAVNSLKETGTVRLLDKNDEEISEQYHGFVAAVEEGKTPTIGGVLAAWYLAVTEEIEEAYYAEDSTMTARQYGARKAALTRLVFSPYRRV